jgi:hypothetical protein
MVPGFPPLSHGFGLGGDSFKGVHFPAGIEEDSLIRSEKEEKLLVEPVRFLFIRREDHQGTLRPVADAGKKVCGGGAFQAVNREKAFPSFQKRKQGIEQMMRINLPTHGNFPFRARFKVNRDSVRRISYPAGNPGKRRLNSSLR